MENLPGDILPSILIFLDTSQIFRNIILLSKTFYYATKAIGFLRGLVQRDFYIQKSLDLAECTCYRLLKESLDFKPKEDYEYLDFKGYSTNGGVDEDNPIYWLENLFEKNQKPYCCRENKTNVNVTSVLVDSQFNNVEYYLSKREAIKIIREWMRQKNRNVQKKCEHAGITIFKYVFSNFPLDAIACGESDPEAFKEKVRYVYQQLEEKQCDVLKSRRYVNDPFLLDIPIDISEANTAPFIACITGLEISRVGHFTCPIKTLIIFTSESYIDVTDPSLSIYDNLTNDDCVKTFLESEPKIKAYPKFEGPGYEYFEFKQTDLVIKPIVWVNFLEDPRVYEIDIDLIEKFSGMYLCAKLICAENRRTEEQWEHENMNIDITWILAKGKVISFEDNL